VLVQAVKGISDVVMIPGLVNRGLCRPEDGHGQPRAGVMGTGVARGRRARHGSHAQGHLELPAGGRIRSKGARGVLINVTGGQDLGMLEHNEAISVIKNEVDPNAEIKCGIVINSRHERRDHGDGACHGFRRRRGPQHFEAAVEPQGVPEDRRKDPLKRRPENGDLFGGRKGGLDKARLSPPGRRLVIDQMLLLRKKGKNNIATKALRHKERP